MVPATDKHLHSYPSDSSITRLPQKTSQDSYSHQRSIYALSLYMACITHSLISASGSNQYSFMASPKQKQDYKKGRLNGCKTIMPIHAKVEIALARLCSDMPYS